MAKVKEETPKKDEFHDDEGNAQSTALLPQLEIKEDLLILDGVHSVDFSSKRRLLEVFKVFLASPLHSIDRTDLIKAMSTIETPTASQRLNRCQAHNAIKTVSRARLFLEENIRGGYENVEWFPYIKRTGTWRLYRLDPSIKVSVTREGHGPHRGRFYSPIDTSDSGSMQAMVW